MLVGAWLILADDVEGRGSTCKMWSWILSGHSSISGDF